MNDTTAEAVKPAPLDWRTILTNAAQMLRQVGLRQGGFGYNDGGPICTNGALRLAAGYSAPSPWGSDGPVKPELNKAMRAFMFAATPEPSSDRINAMSDDALITGICDINNGQDADADGLAAMMEKAAQNADPDEAPTKTEQAAA